MSANIQGLAQLWGLLQGLTAGSDTLDPGEASKGLLSLTVTQSPTSSITLCMQTNLPCNLQI